MQSRLQSIGSRIRGSLEKRLRSSAPRMRVIGVVVAALAIILSIACMIILNNMLATYRMAEQINRKYDDCERSVDTMQEASDFLTTQVRLYATSGSESYLDAYLDELQQRDRRGKAVESLREQSEELTIVQTLEEAERYSDELAKTELYAMRLVAEATGLENMPSALSEVTLSTEDEALSAEQKQECAVLMVYSEDYLNMKMIISNRVHQCTGQLMNGLRSDIEAHEERLHELLDSLRIAIIALLLLVLFALLSTFYLVLWPISMHAERIRKDEPLVSSGAAELRLLTDTYNEMYEEKHLHALILQQEAETDGLTSLLNRGAFEALIGSCMRNIALVLVDVDYFKRFNDDFGHDMGDAVLIEVAATLIDAFRASDYVCRIGGDEFAVIMTGANSSMRDIICKKLDKVSAFLRDTSNGLPMVTVSVGVAFDDSVPKDSDIFKTADLALYATKRNGRDGYTFANDVL